MVSSRFKRLTPYIPGEQPKNRKYIKLNTNENPYPPSPRLKKALEQYDIDLLKLYPDFECTELRGSIARREGISPDQVFVGNGSDEVLSLAWFSFFGEENGPILTPEFTYSFYPVYSDYYNCTLKKIPLNREFQISVSDYLMEPEYCGIAFPNPNAPTGNYLPLEVIDSLCSRMKKDRVLLIDEAYIEFGGESAVSLINKYPQLLITRTASKSHALAGLRLGYALGSRELVSALFAAKDSFNSYPVDRIAQVLAQLAIDDDEYYRNINECVIKTREHTSAALAELGWTIIPSKANFLFASPPGGDGEKYFQEFKERGILVRYFNKPGIKSFLRITIGTDENMVSLVQAAKEISRG